MTDLSPNRSRRRFLGRLLAAGCMGLPHLATAAGPVLAMGRRPVTQGFQRIKGDVRLNGRLAAVGDLIQNGDVVTTGADGMAIFVVDRSVYMLHDNGRLEIAVPDPSLKDKAVGILRMVNGKVLACFGGGRHRIQTPTALAGIRGSGVYVEAEPQRTYICMCYGTGDLQAVHHPDARETVRTRHHEAPRFIYGPHSEAAITPAPMMNHTDAELIMLEKIARRRPPFAKTSGGYSDY